MAFDDGVARPHWQQEWKYPKLYWEPLPTPEGPPIKTIQANGITFSYLEAGSGPLVLCLHGFPDTPHTFDDLLPKLAEAGYRAVAPYMRGYPPSSAPVDGNYSELQLGQDVLALIEALGERDAALVAHDWGALAAHSAASLDPSRLRSMVTVAIPHPSVIRPGWEFFQHSWHFLVFPLPGAGWWMKRDDLAFIERLCRRWSPGWNPSAADLAPVKESLSAPGGLEGALGYYRALASGSTFGAFTREAGEIRALRARRTRVPTLAFVGTEDGASPPAAFDRAAGAFEAPYRLIKVERAGHFLHRERPELFSREVLAFLGCERGQYPGARHGA